MAYDNLPGIRHEPQDGNLTILPTNNNPIVFILGTAGSGDSETVYRVDRVADASAEFAKEGTLTRGLYEAAMGGALNNRLYRIGATSAKLETVGTGLTIETIDKDDSAGTALTIFWDDDELRLRVWRVSDDELVYDNYPSYPEQRIDLGEVGVSGTATTGTGSIGTYAVPITIAAAEGISGAAYTAGTDGLKPSRMKLYELLYTAYKLLEDEEMDVVVPMNVYLDDFNVMDLTAAQIVTRDLTSLADYPTASATDDVLGRVYTEEYEGKDLFWWWFPADPTALTFTAAHIAPSEGASSTTLKSDGTTVLVAADFQEVNFAYQLADFCWRQASDNMDVTGVIGVRPPVSFSLKDVSNWVGKVPETEVTAATGNVTITTNGEGLLGNKFMAGRMTAGGLPGLIIDGVSGRFDGGFIATDDNWLGGTQLVDDNDHLIDIGKYISVLAAYPVLANSSRTTAYTATGAPTYGGYYSVLPVDEAPTNKQLGSVRLPFRINKAKLDLLAGRHYVTFHQKTRGIVITDAPTAARADSDYFRLSTVRQVKDVIDAIREAADDFLGGSLTGAQQAALDGTIGRVLGRKKEAGVIRRSEHQLIITPALRVQGKAIVELKLVPAFELRQITISVALAAA